MDNLKYYKMYPNVKDPYFATAQSACFDVHAFFGNTKEQLIKCYTKDNTLTSKVAVKDSQQSDAESLTVNPGDRVLIPTGIILDIPLGYSVRVHSRSGTALKSGLTLTNNEGIIDSDYVEQLYIMITNTTNIPVKINSGDRIAQLEMIESLAYNLEPIDSKPSVKTSRNGGFGSTGVR